MNRSVMTEGELAALRRVSVSQGIMLESVAQRLCEPGGPHFGSPDKDPQLRLAMMDAAGRGSEERRASVPTLLRLRHPRPVPGPEQRRERGDADF